MYLEKKDAVFKVKVSIPRDPWINNTKLLNVSIEQARRCTQDMGGFAALVDHVVINATPW